MKKATKLTICSIAGIVFSLGCLGFATADTVAGPITLPGGTTTSTGVIEVVSDGKTARFDAKDLNLIYDEVSEGKASIAAAIKNAPDAETPGAGLALADPANGVYTFQELVTGINPWDDIAAGTGTTTYDSASGTYNHSGRDNSANYASVSSMDTLDEAIARDVTASYSAGIDAAKTDPTVIHDIAESNGLLKAKTGSGTCSNGSISITVPGVPKHCMAYWSNDYGTGRIACSSGFPSSGYVQNNPGTEGGSFHVTSSVGFSSSSNNYTLTMKADSVFSSSGYGTCRCYYTVFYIPN